SGEIDLDRYRTVGAVTGTPLAKVIGANIRKLREDRERIDPRWTQVAVQRMLVAVTKKRLFTATGVIGLIEKSERQVKAEELAWLSLLFQVPLWEFFVPKPDNEHLDSKYIDLDGQITDADGLHQLLTHRLPGTEERVDAASVMAANMTLRGKAIDDLIKEMSNQQRAEINESQGPIVELVSLERLEASVRKILAKLERIEDQEPKEG
ncbi:MAG: hypothetical protein M3094_08810, partial [Actinomycetia bacterium]|nr:hypothetical protein [Actinomycetes bacterium]